MAMSGVGGAWGYRDVGGFEDYPATGGDYEMFENDPMGAASDTLGGALGDDLGDDYSGDYGDEEFEDEDYDETWDEYISEDIAEDMTETLAEDLGVEDIINCENSGGGEGEDDGVDGESDVEEDWNGFETESPEDDLIEEAKKDAVEELEAEVTSDSDLWEA